MTDDIDIQTEHVQHNPTRRLYTRCNHCGQYFQMDTGMPCPNPKCSGMMV